MEKDILELFKDRKVQNSFYEADAQAMPLIMPQLLRDINGKHIGNGGKTIGYV